MLSAKTKFLDRRQLTRNFCAPSCNKKKVCIYDNYLGDYMMDVLVVAYMVELRIACNN
jgi:hypothetical protein